MLLIFFTRYWHIFSFLLDTDIAVFIICNQAHPERWGLYSQGKQSGDQKLLYSPWSRSSAAASGGAGSVRNVAWLRASRGAAPSAVKDGKTAPASGFSMINAISITGGRGCETLCEIVEMLSPEKVGKITRLELLFVLMLFFSGPTLSKLTRPPWKGKPWKGGKWWKFAVKDLIGVSQADRW